LSGLPQLNEHIASYLNADKDVANFALVCQATHNAIESHRCGLWRRLYASKFDVPESRTGVELKVKYKLRCRALRRTTNWQKGHDPNEARVMKFLQDLVCGKLTFPRTVIVADRIDWPMGEQER